MHVECAAAEKTYDYDGDILYYSGQFDRGHNHEQNGDTAASLAERGCPACIKQTAANAATWPIYHSKPMTWVPDDQPKKGGSNE